MKNKIISLYFFITIPLFTEESLTYLYTNKEGNLVYYSFDDKKCYESIESSTGYDLKIIECDKNKILITNKEEENNEKKRK